MIDSFLLPLSESPAVPIAPAAILALCVIGGIGTFLLLPSRREAPLRAIGGAILLAAALILVALLIRWTAHAVGGQMGVYFWIFSAIAIFGAMRVVTHAKPVYSALYFVLTVFATAGLFLLLRAEFMAAALVLIYAGAILITYVFVIMLAAEATNTLAVQQNLSEHDTVSRDPLAACSVGFAMMGMILFVIFDKYEAITPIAPRTSDIANDPALQGATQQLGAFLFTNQLMNLELAGLILTIAMVGAIVIARRKVLSETSASGEVESSPVLLGPSTPQSDDPHSIPVYGTTNPRQKAYPQS